VEGTSGAGYRYGSAGFHEIEAVRPGDRLVKHHWTAVR
jgi:hypothetical protein